MIGLLPKLDLALIAEIPAITDDPMLIRPKTREIGRLHGTSHGGNDALDRGDRAARGEFLQMRSMRTQQPFRQSNSVDHNRLMHAGME